MLKRRFKRIALASLLALTSLGVHTRSIHARNNWIQLHRSRLLELRSEWSGEAVLS